MSTRDELADIIAAANYRADGPRMFRDEHAANQILASGFGKKPSRAELIAIIAGDVSTISTHGLSPDYVYGPVADAILALMDRGQ